MKKKLTQLLAESSFWNPNENGMLRRDARSPATLPSLSRFTCCTLHQGRIETFFLDAIREASTSVRIDRKVRPLALRIDEEQVIKINAHDSDQITGSEGANRKDDYAYPIEVTLRHLSENEATPAQRLSNLADGIYRSNLTDDDKQGLLACSSTAGGDGVLEVQEEIVRARYLVGCDGAHSWVRKTLGEEYEMVGESIESIW